MNLFKDPFLSLSIFFSASIHLHFVIFFLLYSLFLPLAVSDQKPLSVEVGEASTLRLLGAEQENAELRKRLEELQAQQEVRVQGV